MSTKSFPKPSDLPIPAGAEGWEKIYPYYLVFQEALEREENEKFWFCDSQHWPYVLKPFETIGAEYAVKCLGQYNARHLLIPNANGIEFRVHLGYLYMSPISVPEEEMAARVPEFQARISHYFQNWDELLEQWKNKVRGTIASSSPQLKGAAVSSPRAMLSTFSARKLLKGEAIKLAIVVKVKNIISSTSTTNSGHNI